MAYRYKHKELTESKFTTVMVLYYYYNGYKLYDYDIGVNWRYYLRKRSWLASSIDHQLENCDYEDYPLWLRVVYDCGLVEFAD